MKTQVCISIDTEFSIGGALSPPYDRKPVADPFVWCDVDGRSQGLGFILQTFAEFGVTGTFFVEALHRAYFPDSPMRRAVDQILSAGHDAQLHLHPVWLLFQQAEWREQARANPAQDRLTGLPADRLRQIFEFGLNSFAAWGAPAPKALRSGNLQYDDGLYAATREVGITISSNIGHAVWRRDDPKYHLYSGMHTLDGVRELPVTSYVDLSLGGRRHFKTLTVAGSSWSETRSLLQRARAAGLPLVVVLTHPFEYARGYDAQFRNARANRVTQSRLRALCRYLAENSHQFQAVTIAQAAEEFPVAQIGRNRLLKGPLAGAARRLAENWISDHC